MIDNTISYYVALTFRVGPLRGELHRLCGTWRRFNFLEWNGRREAGIGQRNGHRDRVLRAWEACIPRRCGFTCTSKPYTSPSPTTGFRLMNGFTDQ
ncbi:MAG: hypothetical protein ABI284_06595 [Nitrosospira sp.]